MILRGRLEFAINDDFGCVAEERDSDTTRERI